MSTDLENEDKVEEISPLDMSDEEAEKLLLSDDELIPPAEENEEEDKSEETTDDSEEEQEASETEEETQPDLEAKDTDAFEESKDTTDTEEKRRGRKPAKKKADAESTEKLEDEAKEIDYKAEYEKLTGSFRANGKDMQIDSVEDALTLMKMGANYNKKMAGLKPNLRLLKMLEKNNLLDESKLSYLIDLDQKNPDAINKLVKDSGVDPLDIDTEKDSEYKPTAYTVDDKEVELDGVLDEIRDTRTFKDTLSIISNKWDDSSKQVLYENPSLIKVINEHVDAGVYNQINAVIERERMLGRMEGMTDIEAYKYVGDAIMANGGFNTSTNDEEEKIDTSLVDNAKPTSKKEDPKLKERKRAASSTKSTSGAKSPDFNPLAMSDEEFEKVSSSQFL